MTKRQYPNTRSKRPEEKKIRLSSIPEERADEKKSDISRDKPVAIFADPTYDTSFKMLFANKDNTHILISLLNNLLNFTGDNEILEIELNPTELTPEALEGITHHIDVLCETKSGKKIAVEMQKQTPNYLLSRCQEYMARMISGQLQAGMSNNYNNDLLDTYILLISQDNIFKGTRKISENDIFYEKTILPIIQETGTVVPDNKIYWKFYELKRFKTVLETERNKKYEDIEIKSGDTIKEQWLNFLIKCGDAKEVPEDIDEIIKEGYKIMEIANWTESQRLAYWFEQRTIAYEQKEQTKAEESKFEAGKIEGAENKTIEIAKNMLSQDFDKKVISSVTGLSSEQIQELSEPMEKDIISEEMIISHEDAIPEHEESVELAGDV